MPESKARVSGDFSDLISGATSAAKKITDLGLTFSGLKAAGKTVDIVTGSLGGMVNVLAKVGFAAQGLSAIGRSAISMGAGLVQGNADLEMTTISFKTLLGSASAANDMIKQLTDFAQKTPFELTGLEANTQKLLAFGFDAKDIIPLMTSMGDAISALGGTQDNLNSLVYVMGQMRGEAHLNAGDIMQMTNLGIPALQMLADHYGKTTGEIQTMISKGLIPGKDAVDIFSTSLEKRYGGMMAAQSATFSGMLSNLQDWFHATTLILTKPLFEPAKQALSAFLAYVQSPAGEAAIKKLAGYIQTGVDDATAAFNRFGPVIKDFVRGLINTGSATINKFTPIISGLTSKLGDLYQKFQPIIDKILGLYQALSPLSIAFDVLQGILTGGIQGGFEALEGHVIEVGNVFGIDLTGAMSGFNDFITNTFLPTFNTVATFVTQQLVPALIGIGQWIFTQGLPAFLGFVQTIVTAVMPVFNNIVNFIINTLIPGFQQFIGWVIKNFGPVWDAIVKTFTQDVMPAIGRFVDFVVTNIIPALQGLFKWVGDNLVPMFEKFVKVFAEDVIPVLGKVVGFIIDTVIPILVHWWEIIATVLKPIFEQLIKFFSDTLLPVLKTVWDFIGNTAIPVIKTLADNFSKYVLPILQKVGEFIGGAFGTAIGVISALFQGWGHIIFDGLIPALGAVWDFISKNILPIFKTVGDVIGTVVSGAIGGLMWGINNLIIPTFNTIVTVVGNVIDFVKNAVRTVANFFVDVINTPLNAINAIFDTLRGIDILGAKPFDWLGHLPTIGYLSFAEGTKNAPGGLSLVGEQGAELIKLSADKIILATRPMLLDLPKGAQVFNNRETRAMLPASAQQISNMYATTNANRVWNNSVTTANSNNNSNNQNYYINGQKTNQWSFAQQMRWYSARQ